MFTAIICTQRTTTLPTYLKQQALAQHNGSFPAVCCSEAICPSAPRVQMRMGLSERLLPEGLQKSQSPCAQRFLLLDHSYSGELSSR